MIIRIGIGSCGIAAGALPVWEAVQEEIADRGMSVELEQTGCIGMCHHEPLLDVIYEDGRSYTFGHVTPEMAREIVQAENPASLEKYLVSSPEKRNSFLDKQLRVALRNCGIIDPESIEDYIKEGGYQALEKIIKENDPEGLIEEIKISGLRGRGGAGFPTWFKWNATRQEKNPDKYVVCNADEGDPGAFMDRSVLEGDPHSLLEGMAIAGYAIGAHTGIIYARAEYPLAVKRAEIAIQQARQKNYLGKNIMGSDFSFDIVIKQGAGAFVCGEETALIASLEGERGMPRLKPPFPSQRGYWQKPTNINNVETFANVPWIIKEGGKAFAAMGTEDSKGTKVFALAGKIKYGGLVEVPMGISLREIIFDVGGGIKDDKQFKAVQLGGPSGGCIPASLMDTPVDYKSINETGAIMGSGGMIVMDETTCMVDLARYFLNFTQKESCGKCVQCRIGTKRMLEILERICRGEGQEGDIELLETLGHQIIDGSLCGLGQSAPNPVLTTIRYFREEYEAHIYDRKCPAHQCKELIKYRIDPDLCKSCGLCAKKCPVDCISGEKKQPYIIDDSKCIKCGSCLEACPTKWSAVVVE
ncbi:NADH:ubiquinone oxidoreductase, 51kDa subunit [Syntrophomonas zehnderi OL-4]|uniref:NADH:ubiquinone oxidoreductase, 51kDa subunit n=1 Tax=Syntrophomonas zehnderi OL-4 TaxID=690567 RepID=A0A0E4C815_9FIRM|nr:NADH-quinone oxidoreductase subunit NuoF [Syntrophomonas zehnderi]CFX22205.1 NADH:ubiquinone oxidoreductase, 51kDa subunit [Syntrophomonas zehnderi OL-4]